MAIRKWVAVGMLLMAGVPWASADQLDLGNPVKGAPAPAEAKPLEPAAVAAEEASIEKRAGEKPAVETTDAKVARLQMELRELKVQHMQLLGALRRAMPVLQRASDAGHIRPAVVDSLKAAMEGDTPSDEQAMTKEADDLLAPAVAKPQAAATKPTSEATPAPAEVKPTGSPLAGETFAHIGQNIFVRQMKLHAAADGTLRLRGQLRNLTFKPFISVGLRCELADKQGNAAGSTLFYVTFSEIEQVRDVDVALQTKGDGGIDANSAWSLKLVELEARN
jgi:hypothetical protein